MIELKRFIKYLPILLTILFSYKGLPLAHLIRFYYVTVKNLYFTRPKYLTNIKDKFTVFKPTIYKTHVSLLEIDFYFHKNNSTYLSDLDMARSDLFTKKLKPLFWYCKNEKGLFPIIPVASVSCHFMKEIKPFTNYDIKSQIFAWDEKWFFVLSRFVQGDKLCCLCISKMIFKNKRHTIPPIELFKKSDIYNDELESINKRNYKLIRHYITESGDISKIADDLSQLADESYPKL